MKIEEVVIESKYNDLGSIARALEMHGMEPNGPIRERKGNVGSQCAQGMYRN